jgi:uncharacterized membrane protein HdeD (DUF308 family)
MEAITGLFIFALLVSITLGTSCVLQIFKASGKDLSEIWKKIITGIVGLVLCLVWYFAKINQAIDLLILTFFAAVGFYDIIIKTITKKIGGSDDSENNTSTR